MLNSLSDAREYDVRAAGWAVHFGGFGLQPHGRAALVRGRAGRSSPYAYATRCAGEGHADQ